MNTLSNYKSSIFSTHLLPSTHTRQIVQPEWRLYLLLPHLHLGLERELISQWNLVKGVHSHRS